MNYDFDDDGNSHYAGSDRRYLVQQLRRVKRHLKKKPGDVHAQERLEHLREQFKAIDTTPWRSPALSLEEMRVRR